jgi:hypothetical protein
VNPHQDFLSSEGGDEKEAEINGATLNPNLDTTILWEALLYWVQPTQALDSGGDGFLSPFGDSGT